MKNTPVLSFFALSILFLSLVRCKVETPVTGNSALAWVKEVGAKKIPRKKKEFDVTAYGALNDGKTLNTKAIQAAIDACSSVGGGIVTFKPGNYLTGSIYLKKGVHLRIDEGVQILGSQNLEDYPEMDTRVAGIEMKWPSALINVLDQEEVAISGKGVVHAQGKPFWDLYWNMRKEYEPKKLRWIVDYDAKRPRTLLVSRSSNVTIENITLKQAGFWTIHILYSDHVTVDGVVIQNNIDGHGPSTDGIDIDSSSYVLVQNSDIDCNDDNFCLKSGRDWDGLRVNRPTEYVVIRNCISRAGGGLITFGSETSGGIRHVLAHDLKAKGTGVGLRFKSATTRGGTVEDIYLQNIEMDGVGTAIEVSMNWNPSYSYSTLPAGYSYETIPDHWKTMLRKVEPEERGIPTFRDVTISNITATNAKKALSAAGIEKSSVQGFVLKNIKIEAATAGEISYASNWTFKNVSLQTKDNSNLKVQNSTNVTP
ncbi:glycoside hydrolase family 28 protein [Rufibacter tibetensis]|uniref:Exo-poly-alpha-D-galacturonosidase n=1 Tax=Rufibacter tibetensis TaxID=512763 RepID=A0A0P0CU54_9BACT|nr:glycoside hydrolase family 28 protein [Rufibacter tibetensis]ALI97839.1 exo-poly-alpha-D-galacturonosidase [Rufibacter tibetensis]